MELVIKQTEKWIRDVVIGLNLCPFAAKEIKNNTVKYVCSDNDTVENVLSTIIEECVYLDNNPNTETTLIILPNSFSDFDDYLEILEYIDETLFKFNYEGIYQVASFHPNYEFEDSEVNDAANYTNRSPYPMLHILREESIEKVLDKYPNHEDIPERNVNFTREKGIEYMKMLRDACF